MLLTGEENIRQTIAFPKTQNGTDLLFGSPAPVSAKQLQELSITVKEHPRTEEAAPPRCAQRWRAPKALGTHACVASTIHCYNR